MGFLDRFRRNTVNGSKEELRPSDKNQDRVRVAGVIEREETDRIQSFESSNVTVHGDLSGYNYTDILKDKQRNIVKLYELSDYYTDADEIVHGIVKHVYVPYSTCSPWQLLDVNEKTRKIYEDKYTEINLKEKIDSIMLQYWKYSNVVIYYFNGTLITLPIHKCRIGNIMLNGDPIVDFDCLHIISYFRDKGYTVKENWIKDNRLETVLKGYPPEIIDALNEGRQYAQLNPRNTFVMQDSKEDWQRYAINFIAACLPALAKKALISQYEDAILNLGTRSFVHVTYGDAKKESDTYTSAKELKDVSRIFSKAMSGFPLAVTNSLAEANVVQADASNLFEWKKYDDVNTSILSAGGISGILVTGVSNDGSTFASAQVSMQTAAVRIDAARHEFCRVVTRINKRLMEDLEAERRYNIKQAPTFTFMPLDMAGQKALRETCQQLWERGVVSTKTMLDMHGYSVDHEKAIRTKELSDGTDSILLNRQQQTAAKFVQNKTDDEKDEGGRPEMDDDERSSDPAAAIRGKQPKPSNPDGSMGNGW